MRYMISERCAVHVRDVQYMISERCVVQRERIDVCVNVYEADGDCAMKFTSSVSSSERVYVSVGCGSGAEQHDHNGSGEKREGKLMRINMQILIHNIMTRVAVCSPTG